MFIVLRLLHISVTHKSNPSTVTHVYADSYSTLGHVVGGNTCGGDTLLRVTDTRWQKGLCSTQSKVKSIVLEAAWH